MKHDIFKVLQPRKWNKLPDTLLVGFIKQKIGGYSEPHKKGIAKGDPIGMSMNKFKASLFMMTNLRQKDIASEMDISYGGLRVWKTEDEFTSLIKKHCTEFADLVFRLFESKINEFLEQAKKSFSLGEEPTMPSYPELKDSHIYGDLILEQIGQKYLSLFAKLKEDSKTTKEEVYKTVTRIYAMQSYFGEMTHSDKVKWARLQGILIKGIFNKFMSGITTNDKKQKEQAHLISKLIEQYIDSLQELLISKT